MPLYEFECTHCKTVFESIAKSHQLSVPCKKCGSRVTKRLVAAPAVHMKGNRSTATIEKRVKDYLLDGKVKEATRFADKAASMVKSDKVKRISDKLHQKTGK